MFNAITGFFRGNPKGNNSKGNNRKGNNSKGNNSKGNTNSNNSNTNSNNSNSNSNNSNLNSNSNSNSNSNNSNTNSNNEGNIYRQMYSKNRGGINWMNIGANDPGPNNGPARRYVNHQLRQPNRQSTPIRNSNR